MASVTRGGTEIKTEHITYNGHRINGGTGGEEVNGRVRDRDREVIELEGWYLARREGVGVMMGWG